MWYGPTPYISLQILAQAAPGKIPISEVQFLPVKKKKLKLILVLRALLGSAEGFMQ